MKKLLSYAMLIMSMFVFTACPSDSDDENILPTNVGGKKLVSISKPSGVWLRYQYDSEGKISILMPYKDDIYKYEYEYGTSAIKISYLNELVYECTLEDGLVTHISNLGQREEYNFTYDGERKLIIVDYSIQNTKYHRPISWQDGDIVGFTQGNARILMTSSEQRINVGCDYSFNPLNIPLTYGVDHGDEWMLPLIPYFGVQPKHLLGGYFFYYSNGLYTDENGVDVKGPLWDGYEFSYQISGNRVERINRSDTSMQEDGKYVYSIIPGLHGTLAFELKWE